MLDELLGPYQRKWQSPQAVKQQDHCQGLCADAAVKVTELFEKTAKELGVSVNDLKSIKRYAKGLAAEITGLPVAESPANVPDEPKLLKSSREAALLIVAHHVLSKALDSSTLESSASILFNKAEGLGAQIERPDARLSTNMLPAAIELLAKETIKKARTDGSSLLRAASSLGDNLKKAAVSLEKALTTDDPLKSSENMDEFIRITDTGDESKYSLRGLAAAAVLLAREQGARVPRVVTSLGHSAIREIAYHKD
ncbi:MAG: hypothetical protein D6719_13570 [Candidatus Dadabacteria bacterium]|nr:MAG: hypothetical protein D6719_13570 [Candidatus Dadabacteria bacterium]